jgi:hypothetical protein
MLTLVATYRRTINASLERIWENVRDWEHLPWLHRSSFLSVTLLNQTPTTWQARIMMPPKDAPREAVIELEMDVPNRRYWSRTLEGQGAGGEILTMLAPSGEHATDIVVEFRALVSSAKAAEALGKAYLRLYEQLWDEDERMMRRRQELIDAGRIGVEPKVLKRVEVKAVIARLKE